MILFVIICQREINGFINGQPPAVFISLPDRLAIRGCLPSRQDGIQGRIF
jgi:hypothetical protein